MAVQVEHAPVTNYQFIERVSHYPIVQNTYQQLTSYYEWTKAQNSVVSRTLSLVENGVNMVATTVQPLLPKVAGVDDLVCSQLNKLEHTFPLIHKPTDQIIQDTKEIYEARVKPKVDTLITPLTITYEVVSSGARLATSTASALVVYSAGQVAKLAEVPLFERVLDVALDKADSYVEYYLPAEAEEEEDDMLEVPHTKDGALCRLKYVSEKARRRALVRANRRLSSVKTVGQDAVVRLLGVLKQSPAHLQALVVEQHQPNSASRQMLEKARHYATIVRHCVVTSGHQLFELLSTENQIRLEQARIYSEMLLSEITAAKSLARLNETYVQQGREMLAWIQTVLRTNFGNSSPSSTFSTSDGDQELECVDSGAVAISSNAAPSSIMSQSHCDPELSQPQDEAS